MANQSKKLDEIVVIYIKGKRTEVKCSSEFKKEYEKLTERIRKREYRHHRCNKKKNFKCKQNECSSCPFYKLEGFYSLDELFENEGYEAESSYLENTERDTLLSLQIEEIKEFVNKRYPGFFCVFEKISSGYNKREIAKQLNLPSATLHDRIKKIQKEIKENFLEPNF